MSRAPFRWRQDTPSSPTCPSLTHKKKKGFPDINQAVFRFCPSCESVKEDEPGKESSRMDPAPIGDLRDGSDRLCGTHRGESRMNPKNKGERVEQQQHKRRWRRRRRRRCGVYAHRQIYDDSESLRFYCRTRLFPRGTVPHLRGRESAASSTGAINLTAPAKQKRASLSCVAFINNGSCPRSTRPQPKWKWDQKYRVERKNKGTPPNQTRNGKRELREVSQAGRQAGGQAGAFAIKTFRPRTLTREHRVVLCGS